MIGARTHPDGAAIVKGPMTQSAADTTQQTATAPAAPAAASAQPQQAPEDDPGIIKLTSEQMKERLSRAQTSYLKEQFGVKDPAELKAQLEALKSLQEAEEARKREAMTREQQLQADLERQQAEAREAQEARDAVIYENRVIRICAKLGVKEVEYAMWAIAKHAEGIKDGEQFDAEAYLTDLLKEPQKRAALGVGPVPEVQPVGVTTSPASPSEPRPAGNGPAPAAGAFGMDSRAWAERKARLGIG